jgi:propionyl-CoA carboxylase alpha chain
MFDKILIANRGEIACRIISAARRMGIATVAVYSDADEEALHTGLADEAVRIGPPPAQESYLAIGKIISACKNTGAQAVHPGYGFLAEQAGFARALEENGIVFIGPNPAAIALMGDKIQSKKLALAAGVAAVPGFPEAIEDVRQAAEAARALGYPVIVKAAAGGGGRGMRVVSASEQLAADFARAQSEAKSAFGDGRVFLEKFIAHPRHIEIQLLADKHGNVVHLGERECSIQRRHQKVIEEAPSPFLDEATRHKMGEQAVALAKMANYDSAGTAEFIVAADKSFYFLEMNTRLQVEHPVTEFITGIDIVEQMIRSAAGERLGLSQEQIALNGWAIESRILAEDPERGFLPSTGRLTAYRPPAGVRERGAKLRIDSGVREGSEISLHYDSLLAKLISHAPHRAEAIEAQAQALGEFVIEGVATNLDFLAAAMASKRFRAGELSTGFIEEEWPHGFMAPQPQGETARLFAAVAAAAAYAEIERQHSISGQMRPWRKVNAAYPRSICLGKERYDVMIEGLSKGMAVRFENEGDNYLCISDWAPGQPVWKGASGGKEIAVKLRRTLNGYHLAYGGAAAEARIYTRREADLIALMPQKTAGLGSRVLRSPMPALVKSILVNAGEPVKKGEELCVIEAMKMETVLRAESDATVEAINAKPGDTIAADAIIIRFS